MARHSPHTAINETMHLPACPVNWEYENDKKSELTLTRRSVGALSIIRNANIVLKDNLARDTRPFHGQLFKELTPEHFPYFAGNYRGYAMRCLSEYEVGIKADKRVGHPAATVHLEMVELESGIVRAQAELDLVWRANSKIFSREHKLLRTIELAAAIFVYWLEIHPYANGNGHMARFLLICLFGRHNLYFNSNWKIHPRPSEPEYSKAISEYRSGQSQALHMLLLAAF